ncbi:MAG TPA: stage II sporulation protein M [Thermoanaerobaculia bacterium]|jgi:uncharacterized membrane protein SpoIIM required for sporulation
MNREAFERQYQDDWKRLGELLDHLERVKKSDVCGGFPELYRRVCHQLALVRSRLYGTDLEQHLNGLVLRGHHQLYRRSGPTWTQVADFFVAGFPRLVRREARLVGVAVALLFGPLLAMVAAVAARPELAYSVIDPATAAEYQSMYDPADSMERGSQTDFYMFGFYVYNNVSIAFQTFAGGILFAVGSIVYLVINGVVIGTVAGHMVNVGNGDAFFPFVVGHGSFELVAIALAGASGLKLGLALAAPGRRSRRAALVAAGRESIRMVYGIFGMLVLAAFVEAFWSSSTVFPSTVKYVAGGAGWVAVAAYFTLAGRDGRAA